MSFGVCLNVVGGVPYAMFSRLGAGEERDAVEPTPCSPSTGLKSGDGVVSVTLCPVPLVGEPTPMKLDSGFTFSPVAAEEEPAAVETTPRCSPIVSESGVGVVIVRCSSAGEAISGEFPAVTSFVGLGLMDDCVFITLTTVGYDTPGECKGATFGPTTERDAKFSM